MADGHQRLRLEVLVKKQRKVPYGHPEEYGNSTRSALARVARASMKRR